MTFHVAIIGDAGKVWVGHADFFLLDIRRPLAYRAAPSPAFFAAGTRYSYRRQRKRCAADRDYARITRSGRRCASPVASEAEQRFRRRIVAASTFHVGVIHASDDEIEGH